MLRECTKIHAISKKRQHAKVITRESDVDSLVTLLYVLTAEWKLNPKIIDFCYYFLYCKWYQVGLTQLKP